MPQPDAREAVEAGLLYAYMRACVLISQNLNTMGLAPEDCLVTLDVVKQLFEAAVAGGQQAVDKFDMEGAIRKHIERQMQVRSAEA